MNTPLHIELLEVLKNEGIGVEYDISKFIIKNFKKPIFINREEYNKQARPAALFIEDLKRREFIGFDGDDNQYPYNSISFDGQYKWYDERKINAYITSIGLDYLNSFKYQESVSNLNESYKDVNKASLKNYQTQKRLAYLTFAFATISALISYLTYIKTDQTALSVDKLRQELKTWKVSQENKKNQITFPMVLPHKP